MKLHEVAKEMGAETKDVIAHLNKGGLESEAITSHMITLTAEQEAEVREAFGNSMPEGLDNSGVEEDSVAEPLSPTALLEEIERLKDEVKQLTYLSEQQEGEVAELEQTIEELKKAATTSPAPIKAAKAKAVISKAEREKLTKGMDEEQITKIKLSLKCEGTRSQYYPKYSPLV